MAAESGIGGGAAGLWYRVQAVSQRSLGGGADGDYASVLPAALNAARHRLPFIAGWLSLGGGAPLELVTNAGPLPAPGLPARARTADNADNADGADRADGADGAADPAHKADAGALRPISRRGAGEPSVVAPGRAAGEDLLFPWGARGVVIDRNMLADLDQLVWAPCPGRQVALGADAVARAARAAGPPGLGQPTLFESALQTVMGRPFGWLIVADPTDLLDAETVELRNQLTVLRQYEDEHARFDADRIQRRLGELDAYREAGLWNVRVLAGAATEQELRLIAPVLVGAVDLSAHPYRLRCPDGAQEFADVLAARTADPADGSAVPFAATAGVLVALTGLPEREVPGVRVMQPGYFDLTSETPAGPSIELGTILDGQDRPVGAMRIPLATLNRHALVAGATGAGKSQTVRHVLEQLTGAGVSWLAIEPVKSEYAVMAARLAGTAEGSGVAAGGGRSVTIINPADPESVPLSVNPLAPEPGYPVQAHIDMVRALFLAAFDAPEPFPQIMSQALQRCYEECGWDPLTGAGPSRCRRPARGADAGQAPGGGARCDRGRGLRPGTAGRHAGLRRRSAQVATDRLGWPLLRGWSPGGHRRAPGSERGPRARGRRQRRGQGVRDRHLDHQNGRAPTPAVEDRSG